MKKSVLLFIIAVGLSGMIYAQEIVTAEKYMERVSGVYSGFRDYEARIAIRSGDSDMYGTVSHRSPYFLRIDFTNPAEQVIVFNGEMLTVYLPGYRAVLTQTVPGGGKVSGAGLATGNGLVLLRRNFAASFLTGPTPVRLDDASAEMVVKIRLTRRYGAEGFREIILSVDPQSLLIRRMQGITITGGSVQFDFSNIKTNIGIPELRFAYDTPPSANIYNNFLLRDTE
ncbi:MAG: outer membrane lipoprotein carrier protein LolA [Spirochaetaceae bacterium]|jgi:outer membrane lipoprotein-sorting protein|nr:outer membrane lipoprotein carrier protein LolA [Spirochaetaceae bacterium]